MLEQIAEKIFWNLKSKFKNEEEYETFDLGDYEQINEKLKQDNYYKTFINKILNINKKEKKVYYKKMEGSSYIFNYNGINKQLSAIFFNRQAYEDYMKRGIIPTENSIYYQLDYCFPNLNLCRPFIYKDEVRRKRIKLMYYDDNSESNWSKLFENIENILI